MADDLTQLLHGVAAQLAADGVGTWAPGAVTPPSDTPVISIETAITSQDRAIILTEYTTSTLPGLTDTVTAINLFVRGTTDPDVVRQMAGDIYRSLQARRGTLPGGAQVTQMWQQSQARVGPDQNRRICRSINFYVQWNRAHQGAV